MKLQIERNSKVPVYSQIIRQLRRRILSGELPGGSALPSERNLAQLLGVHRNTVVRAYGELKADGLIQARRGSGYVVCASETQEAFPVSLRPGRRASRGKSVNWVNQIKKEHLDMETAFDDLFERADGVARYSLGSGIAQAGVYDREKLARDVSRLIAREDPERGFHCPYKGDRGLRQQVVSFLSTKGIHASVGEIQIVQEMNQAMLFLATLLIRPGDTVLMEEPASPDVYRIVELAGGKPVFVPVDRDGMDCGVLEKLVRSRKPRLIFVNSSFHDPTGAILSTERRRRIIELSNAFRIPVIEEDAASELVYEGESIPPVKALDTLGNVIYIYSFSLTFVPGLSLAFVAADKSVIESMSHLVSLTMTAPGWMTQKLAQAYLEDGSYYACLDAFRARYASKQRLVCRMLDDMAPLGVSYERPRGGVYVWCRLPEGIDSKVLAARAAGRGLTLMPGYLFYPGKKAGRDHIRISYSYEPEEHLAEGMELLRKTLEELLR